MKFDVLVVGAGSAGAVIATRLSENPDCRVGLIEAGPDFDSPDTLPDRVKYLGMRDVALGPVTYGPDGTVQTADAVGTPLFDWGFIGAATRSRPHMPVPRGRVVGGTSAINSAMFVRATREDFDSWVAAGNTEWSYDQVLPYYRKLETDHDFQDEYHGSDGPMPVMRLMRPSWHRSDVAFEEACIQLGYPTCEDHNNPDSTGVGPTPRNSMDGLRMSVARAYLSMARQRPNLAIMANTVVRRIIFKGPRAVALEITGAAETVIAADEIVLSAGAVKSPHLLMLSGVGPAAQLRKFDIPVVADLNGVGQNLRDHPAVSLLWRRNASDTSRTGATEGLPGLGGGACHLRFTAPSSTATNDSRITAPKREVAEDHPDASLFDRMYAGLYLAASKGELGLHSNDADVQPFLHYRLLDEENDRARMRNVVELAIEISRQGGMSKIFGDLVDPAPDDLKHARSLDAWLEQRVRTSHHISSTAKMGPSTDPEAVVDQHGRVHGLDGLRVADASIMPDCVRHNTNMTTIMIGERLADFIATTN